MYLSYLPWQHLHPARMETAVVRVVARPVRVEQVAEIATVDALGIAHTVMVTGPGDQRNMLHVITNDHITENKLKCKRCSIYWILRVL